MRERGAFRSIGDHPVTAPVAAGRSPRLRAFAANPLLEAKRLRSAGYTPVATIAAVVPEEVILAAGTIPIALTPEMAADTPLADSLLGANEDPALRSLLQQLAVEGREEFALAVIGPPDNQVSIVVEELRRDGLLPDRAVPTMFFEMLVGQTERNRAYARDRTRDLAKRIQALTGIEPSDDRLRSAIAVTNARRAAVRRFLARARQDNRLGGAEIFEVLLAQRMMHPVDYTDEIAALTEALESAEAAAKRPGVLLVPFSPLLHSRAHRAIEDAGLNVLATLDPWGRATPFDQLEVADDPLAAVSDYWFERQAGLRVFPSERRLSAFRQAAGRADVVAVVFYVENLRSGWDIPAMQRMLEELGKPSTILRFDARTDYGIRDAKSAFSAFAKSLTGVLAA